MSETEKPAKRHRSIWYGIARALGYVVFHTICPVRIHHVERINRPAPFLLIGNHNSWLDPVAMCYRIHGQQVAFLGKKELISNKLAKAIFTDMGIIAVDRHNSDMEAMRACMRALRDGRILGIFPEGTRHNPGLMDQIEGGTALIALRCNVPMVPVYFDGKIRPFHFVNMYVGKEIPMDDLVAQGVNKATCDQLLERITQTYADMAAHPEK